VPPGSGAQLELHSVACGVAQSAVPVSGAHGTGVPPAPGHEAAHLTILKNNQDSVRTEPNHPTPSSLILDADHQVMPHKVAQLMFSSGANATPGLLLNNYCTRYAVKAMFSEAGQGGAGPAAFGCTVCIERGRSQGSTSQGSTEVVFGPATGWGQRKQVAKAAAAAQLLELMLQGVNSLQLPAPPSSHLG